MDRKWTHVIFAGGGLVLAWFLSKTIDWLWGYFAKPNSMTVGAIALVVAGIVAFVAWSNEKLFNLANEVAGELRKVTWPSREETVNSTFIVIVTTIVAAVILGSMDQFWAFVTKKIFEQA